MSNPKPLPSVSTMLEAKLPARHVKSLVGHFQTMIEQFQLSHWEPATTRSGKFVESTLKVLWVHLEKPLPKAKDFKVDLIIRQLEQLPSAQVDDTIRLTIPRACRFVYEVASNRGARHDPEEINPNQMDARAVVSLCAWILAELLRFTYKGSLDLSDAEAIVDALTQKRFPPIEEVEGRIYFHFKGLSARDVALLALWKSHPGRMNKSELIETARRHGSSTANAKMGVSRLDRVVDDDGHGNLRILAPGIEEAEKLISQKRHE